ncbi:hypothetical protein BC832DRAFT_591284 [Gaertneriomyces semiglobifer]|nr:hypothetical protein BC832DRAFT_591284 [Gaertneriomyces semiglobifer]
MSHTSSKSIGPVRTPAELLGSISNSLPAIGISIIDAKNGTILASSGDLENDTQTAQEARAMILETKKLPQEDAADSEKLTSISIAFSGCSLRIAMDERYIYAVKTRDT